jgi:hypothetical protein
MVTTVNAHHMVAIFGSLFRKSFEGIVTVGHRIDLLN